MAKIEQNLKSNTDSHIVNEPVLANYTYLYITEEMISDAEEEVGIKYPNVMEYVFDETFTIRANNLTEANEGWLEFQKTLGKIFELDEEVECDGKFLKHNLEQDWDTYYFDPNNT